MIAGKVIGSLWSTRKDEKLNGWKMLVVEMIDHVGREDSAKRTIIAADNAGAGIGDMVLVTTGGSARHAARNPEVPLDAMIVGIIDSIDVEIGSE